MAIDFNTVSSKSSEISAKCREMGEIAQAMLNPVVWNKAGETLELTDTIKTNLTTKYLTLQSEIAALVDDLPTS